ncbi:MAG: SbcC/MukB-like Walker B domain-containing protein [Eubacteriales bacterium]|nr:SbcC/MukB-like Walker B domain-containing protein [Eubacteriales bacterium]
MKRLTRMKLIHWHSFENETIEFGDSVLLSGENGAGKSTLLDAMQLVITVSKNNFNKAAHEHGKRKLSGYVRYKTGKENRPYERTGQVTAHVALEFYDESKKSYFIVGAVVDSASEDSDTTVWYRMENTELRDELFFTGRIPKNIDAFRSTNKTWLKMITKTQVDARKDFKGRFGRLEDKFFELIPKSLAFKPIDDIKDFVYSYVLDKKEVNIEALKENVRTYQELEILLNSIRVKIEKLEVIREKYHQILDCIKKDRFYEYYIARADLELNAAQISDAFRMIGQCKTMISELQKEERKLTEKKDQREELIRAINLELDKNEDYIAIRKIEEKLEQIKTKIEGLEEEKGHLMDSVRKALGSIKSLAAIELFQKDEILKEFTDRFTEIENCEEISSVRNLTDRVIAYKKEKHGELSNQIFEAKKKEEQLAAEMTELNHRIENLSKRKLDYGKHVDHLQTAIKEELVHLGRNREVRVLCELLNITDETWRNAIEGYLNTQKFYLLVEPEDFDIALSVYERLKKDQGLHSVGVINTRKLEEYEEEKEGSLAAKITSKNVYAKRFVNMLLNNVVLCERVEDLKKYNRAITPSCVRYQNRVAVVISPGLYEVPFIGAEAYKVQLERAKLERAEKRRIVEEVEAQLVLLNKAKLLLSHDGETGISYRLPTLLDLRIEKQRKADALKEKKRLEENTTLLFKQMERERLLEESGKIEEEKGRNQKEQGGHLNQIQSETERRQELLEKEKKLKTELERIETGLLESAIICRQEYERILKGKNLNKLREDYEGTRKGNWTKKGNLEGELLESMARFKSDHDFGGEASLRGYPVFEEAYNKLKDSELLNYEEKVQKAKEAAEAEFREQFLSKMQENIKKAHGEFDELNRALAAIPFGSDYYKFEYAACKKYKLYYNMIMDDFNIIDGESLFSGAFNQRHREVIEELFDKLTAEGENSNKILEEFTDYRTYMDYDIRISHGDGDYSYYSKVCEEKSGGETQTPFYVTVAASFMQLYSNNIGGDAIGLILLDEAFNNMDDERIAGVLEFFGRLPLQIIVAAPPDKIQYIQPTLKHTLLVLKDGAGSYVENFAYEKLS